MSGAEYKATASTDVMNSEDGKVYSLVLKFNVPERDMEPRLVDTAWFEDINELTKLHGGVGMSSKGLRAGYDPNSSEHYVQVRDKLGEKFDFRDPK